VVTDGDMTASRIVRKVAVDINAEFIESSAGNPTPDTITEIVAHIIRSKSETILVLADDGGGVGAGQGSLLIETLLSQNLINEAIIVASNQRKAKGSKVVYSVSSKGMLIKNKGVTKRGEPTEENLVKGDTVDVLRLAKIPKVGIGDIGKAPRGDKSIEVLKLAVFAVLSAGQDSFA
jgi:methionine synthase I (cobalamin-dependent)